MEPALAKVNGLDKLTYAELLDLRSRIDTAIVERQGAEKLAIAKKLEAIATDSGFTLNELFGKKSGRKASARSATTTSTVAVKYRNPKDPSQTWSGRGRMASWLADAVKKGQKLESFKV